MLAHRYGRPPHTWLEIDGALTSFDWEVLSKANAE